AIVGVRATRCTGIAAAVIRPELALRVAAAIAQMNCGTGAGLQSERVDEGERAATHIPVPVPCLRVARIHRGHARRVGGPPAAEGGAVIAHQEIVLPGDDVLLLAGEAAVAASRGERLPVRRVADRAPNRVRWG